MTTVRLPLLGALQQ